MPPTYELLVRTADGKIINLGNALIDSGFNIAVLEGPHANVHRGLSYTGGSIKTALGNGSSLFVVGQNNSSKYGHTIVSFSASAASIVRTIGNISSITGGSAIPSYNRKSGLVDSGVVVTFDTVIDNSDIVVMKERYLPGGTGPFASGGQSSFSFERIIAPGGIVGVEVENVSGGVMDHLSVEWDFYLVGG